MTVALAPSCPWRAHTSTSKSGVELILSWVLLVGDFLATSCAPYVHEAVSRATRQYSITEGGPREKRGLMTIKDQRLG